MTDNMQRARELLAAEMEAEGSPVTAHHIRAWHDIYLRGGYRAALRAIAAALRLAVPEWRPIETAPSDSTDFYCENLNWPGAHEYGVGFWPESHRKPITRDSFGEHFEPTHWMSLPAAPTVSAEGEG